jgi:formylglycine-generating enzyme
MRALILLVALVSCSSGTTHVATSALDARGCSAGAASLTPYAVDWSANDRATFDARARGGAVVVRYDGCRFAVLSGCRGPGAYGFHPTTTKHEIETIRTSSELHAALPVGAARLEANLAHAGALRVEMNVTGVWEATQPRIGKTELVGACEGATHVVASYTAGSFELSEDTQAGASAGGGSVKASTSRQGSYLAKDANAVLRLTLARVDDGVPMQTRCPRGTLWNGSECTARVDRACPAGTQFEENKGCVLARSGAAAATSVVIPDSQFSFNQVTWLKQPGIPMNVRRFEIDVYEVKVEAYQVCVDAGKCTQPTTDGYCNYPHKPRHPVNCVDFHQATSYCAFVGKRLPTEIEWELAARGTDGRDYPWGLPKPDAWEFESKGSALCWKRGPGQAGDADGTCPTGSYPTDRSPFGVHDMAGDVAEWTSSPFCAVTDRNCANLERVIRGGSWAVRSILDVEVSGRRKALPNDRSDRIGFRCAGGS